MNSNGEVSMPTAMHELSTAAIKYYSSNAPKNSSGYSKEVLNNYYARLLDGYMTRVGMKTLASEWWHFQDNVGYNRLASATGWNGCYFQVTDIVSKGDLKDDNLFETDYLVDFSNEFIFTDTDTDSDIILSNIRLLA